MQGVGEAIIENWKEIAAVLAIISSLWVSVGKKIRNSILIALKIKSEQLTIEERYDKFVEARIEKLLNTISHYEEITSSLETVARDRLEMIEEYRIKNRTLKAQLEDQDVLINKYKSIIEDDKAQLEKADSLLRKFKIYIKKLEGLLKENKVIFDKMDIDSSNINFK